MQSLSLVLLATACDGGPVEPPATLEVALTGRLERGVEFRAELRSNGVPVPEDEVVWTIEPAEAAQVTGPGSVRIVRAGPLTLSATFGSRTVSYMATAAVPPAIVYDRLVAGNRDIWTASLDGDAPVRLTSHIGDDSDPSAAAGSVVFVSYRNGNADLYMVPVEGGPEVRLTTSTRNEAGPSLARDGRRVAYTNDASGITKLWTLDVVSGGAAPLSLQGMGATAIHANPAWRANSDTLVFMSTARGGADLHLARAGTGVNEPITRETSAEVEPAINADGTKVVFVSNRDGNDELYILTLSTGVVERLTHRPGSDAHPAWLSDGRIVYTATVGGVTSLYWLDPSNPEDVHPIPGTEGGGHPSAL